MYDGFRAEALFLGEDVAPARILEVRLVSTTDGLQVWETVAMVGTETEIYYSVGPEDETGPFDAYLRGRIPGGYVMDTAADALDHYRNTHVNPADSALEGK